ncbi:hypothetical protein OWR29_40215 [Actinoplanes sp. Pm04-4]|uniref:DedA family protein n=1 Tax=Paractinoplanes pyxinae TaxID=2997416 RepID=A0ABT4BCQ3_9ACTN|nr:hypothetical protein [Actinoplanes pyxinae]MCY1144256.1 hypothetical protein [Actinoplanes pyxinae]
MDLTQAVLQHPYLVLGPMVLVEGPAATIAAGTLVGAGLAVFWPIWAIVVLAEVVGDSLLYLLGRWARRPWAARVLRKLRVHRLAEMPLPRLVVTAKLVDVFALPAFVSAGLSRIPYRRFAAWVGAIAAVRGLVLIGLGALLGSRLTGLLDRPGGIFLLTAAVAVPVALFHLVSRHYFRKGNPSCASSSEPTPTPLTSTAPPPLPSAWPWR